jgi:hypothetical protein
MLKINLENEKLLVFSEDGKQDASVSFEPLMITVGDKIKIHAVAGGVLIDKNIHYSQIEVAGITYPTAKETHAAIMELCVVFKKGFCAAGEPGTGGTTIHNLLTGREEPNAHPIPAITGLQEKLQELEEKDSSIYWEE